MQVITIHWDPETLVASGGWDGLDKAATTKEFEMYWLDELGAICEVCRFEFRHGPFRVERHSSEHCGLSDSDIQEAFRTVLYFGEFWINDDFASRYVKKNKCREAE